MTRVRTPLTAAAALAAVTLLASCSAPVTVETEAPVDETRTEVAVELPVAASTDDDDFSASDEVESTTDSTLREGYSYVIDDSDVLSVVVPDEWEVDGRPYEDANGGEWAGILASPDLDKFFSDWTVAGVDFSGFETGGQVDDEVLLEFLTSLSEPFVEQCETDHEAAEYFDGVYTGYVSTFTDCAGEGVYGFNIVAQDPEYAHFVYLSGKFVSDEDKDYTLDVIVSTFQSTQGITEERAARKRLSPSGPGAPAPIL